jgi:hypothetical protein
MEVKYNGNTCEKILSSVDGLGWKIAKTKVTWIAVKSTNRQTDRQTDERTDRLVSRQTDK